MTRCVARMEQFEATLFCGKKTQHIPQKIQGECKIFAQASGKVQSRGCAWSQLCAWVGVCLGSEGSTGMRLGCVPQPRASSKPASQMRQSIPKSAGWSEELWQLFHPTAVHLKQRGCKTVVTDAKPFTHVVLFPVGDSRAADTGVLP